MKRKSSKRSIFTKNGKNSSASLTPIIDSTTITPNLIDLGIGTVHLDSHAPCLKANLELKSLKALKRDLLRCSDQRPSLLGPHTLQPPRIHHGSQQTNASTASSAGSSSVSYQQPVRRHSLSMSSRALLATIDRIGPWPDISISRLRSDGNELLRPLKNFRNPKNPRLFSPKYYAGLHENISKFQVYSSTRSYIDEYRKQKGYVLGSQDTQRANFLPLRGSATLEQHEDEKYSGVGAFSSAVPVETQRNSVRDRQGMTTTELPIRNNPLTRSANDLYEHMNTPPSIPAVTKVFTDPTPVNNFPLISMRNGQLRPARQPTQHTISSHQHQQQPTVLPSLNGSSLNYFTSMNSIEKAYSNNKKLPVRKTSKLVFIDERNRQKYRITNKLIY